MQSTATSVEEAIQGGTGRVFKPPSVLLVAILDTHNSQVQRFQYEDLACRKADAPTADARHTEFALAMRSCLHTAPAYLVLPQVSTARVVPPKQIKPGKPKGRGRLAAEARSKQPNLFTIAFLVMYKPRKRNPTEYSTAST